MFSTCCWRESYAETLVKPIIYWLLWGFFKNWVFTCRKTLHETPILSKVKLIFYCFFFFTKHIHNTASYKSFNFFNSFNINNHDMNWFTILPYRWGNCRAERFNNLPKVIQFINHAEGFNSKGSNCRGCVFSHWLLLKSEFTKLIN